MSNNNEDEDLPPVVREIKQNTEELILCFDQAFLHTCGVLWEHDLNERAAAQNHPFLRAVRRLPTRE